MEVDEVDSDDAVSRGEVPGIKCAAVRKLQHELGIALGTLDPARFKYLTRLHYWAADVVTHGEVAPWGEHEIDYILFYRYAVQTRKFKSSFEVELYSSRM